MADYLFSFERTPPEVEWRREFKFDSDRVATTEASKVLRVQAEVWALESPSIEVSRMEGVTCHRLGVWKWVGHAARWEGIDLTTLP